MSREGSAPGSDNSAGRARQNDESVVAWREKMFYNGTGDAPLEPGSARGLDAHGHRG
jgi:hypothetical protein